MIKWKQEAMGFDDFGLDFYNPDFIKYAESYGAIGQRVDSCKNLKTTLKKCLECKGVYIIDIPIDYTENHRVLNKELQAIECIPL